MGTVLCRTFACGGAPGRDCLPLAGCKSRSPRNRWFKNHVIRLTWVDQDGSETSFVVIKLPAVRTARRPSLLAAPGSMFRSRLSEAESADPRAASKSLLAECPLTLPPARFEHQRVAPNVSGFRARG